MSERITADLLIKAYASGIFPMAESRDDDEIYFVDPKLRGVLPLEGFRLSRSLKKCIRQGRFRVTTDQAFTDVIRACAEGPGERKESWINDQIIELYNRLFDLGLAHSVECWSDDRLVGGLYGVTLYSAFFGESMFHTETDASKVALAYLVARLREGDFMLLDTQFVTDHLRSLGVIEITRKEYHERLGEALQTKANFYRLSADASADTIVQLITQTS